MKHDDDSVGRILTRREALAALGVGGGALAIGRWALGPGPEAGSIARGHQMASTLPACVVRPEQTEGPFFVDTKLNRSDIRSDPSTGAVSEGAPLTLRFNVSQISAGACSVLAGAMVDVWQCDAEGVYWGVDDDGAPPGARERQFLRGFQRTDENGVPVEARENVGRFQITPVDVLRRLIDQIAADIYRTEVIEPTLRRWWGWLRGRRHPD